ncbi:MAG: metallophosphoesterase family protein [Armatimonadetes bacterium]|nr:metallophosphoesterase family protein [Armatimonadota bacterium]
MRIGLLSDTHGRALPPELLQAFESVALILHAGDIGDLSLLGELGKLAEVRAVGGNIDATSVLLKAVPTDLSLQVEGVWIGVAHGHVGRGRTTAERAMSWFPHADVVIFGHSHRPLIEQRGKALLINPGSPTDPRGAPQRTCAVLTVEAGQASAELVGW